MSRLSIFRNWFYEQLVKELNFESVLDVGCGKGDFLEYCKKRGVKKIAGIDPESKHELAIKKDFFKNNFQNNSFDLVFSTHVIEHVDGVKFAKECARIARKFVIIASDEPCKSFWNDPTHLRPYTVKSLKKVLESAGLKPARVFKIPFVPTIAVTGKKEKQN